MLTFIGFFGPYAVWTGGEWAFTYRHTVTGASGHTIHLRWLRRS